MSALFEPLRLRGLTLRNRVMASPMCQYSAVEGMPQEWHHVHLGGMARGGVALVMTEATSVTPEGRISPQDTGIWSDAHTAAWAPIVGFLHSQGAAAGMQLAHAGHKASTWRPWAAEKGSVPLTVGGWRTVGPSSSGYPGFAAPRALTAAELPEVVAAFAQAARRALAAGFDTVEVHGAHGYLLHQFLSPITNHRTDGYGGDLAGRARLLLEVVAAVREVWPEDRPVLVRLSATDWVEGGHDLAATVQVARWLRAIGVDLIDVSSGGASPDAEGPARSGLPGSAGRHRPPRRGGRHSGCGTHHVRRAGRGDHRRGIGRPGRAGPGAAARPAVAAARGPRAGLRGSVAGPAAPRQPLVSRAEGDPGPAAR